METELSLKEKQLCDLFKRNGDIDNAFRFLKNTISAAEYEYRNRVRFAPGKNNRPGFRKGRTRSIIEIDQCPVLVSSLNDWIGTRNISEDTQLFSDFNTVYESDVCLELLGRQIHFNAQGFFQSNLRVFEMLLKQINLGQGDLAWDLYGGVGIFSMFLQESYKDVHCVELYEPAHQLAKENGIKKHHTEDVFKFLAKQNEAPDMCFIDPPRVGMDPKVLRELCRLKPQKIMYLSCDPATQARDVGYLVKMAIPCNTYNLLIFIPEPGTWKAC